MPIATGQEREAGSCSSTVSADLSLMGDGFADLGDRLVESSRIKKAIDSLYTAFLPKGASPWVYLRSVRLNEVDKANA